MLRKEFESMKSFIFVTTEGFTFQPDSESIEPDTENCQVVGFGEGNNAREALENMIMTQTDLLKTSFDKISAFELKDEHQEFYYLSSYKS